MLKESSTSQVNKMRRYFRNIKTKVVYLFLGIAENCTNDGDAAEYIIYKSTTSEQLFIRKHQEFFEKFEEV